MENFRSTEHLLAQVRHLQGSRQERALEMLASLILLKAGVHGSDCWNYTTPEE